MSARHLMGVVVIVFVALWKSDADVISYLRFEGNATDETGLMDGELINFDSGVDYEGFSTNVFASTIPLTGEPNTGSIRFAGGSEFVDLSNANDLYLGTDFTIEFYMYPEDPGGGVPVFGLSPYSRLYTTLGMDGGSLIWWTQFQDQFSAAPADMVQLEEWQHVAFVFESTEYTIYIDGQVQYVGGIPPAAQGAYYFPGTGVTGDRTIGDGFRGYIDEFRISDEALTPDQFLMAPEPGTLGLLALGGLALYATRRRIRSSSLTCVP